jgi:hypothetical protein
MSEHSPDVEMSEKLEPVTDWVEIGNEFASVCVRKVLTRNGARLEVSSPRRNLNVYLDSTVLEALTWQTPESLSILLETPLQPLRRRSLA